MLCRWLDDCLVNHESCKQTEGQASFYPSRLIDVGSEESLDIVLRDSREYKLTGSYITLSHCWGSSPIVTLVDLAGPCENQKNGVGLENLKTGFPLTSLPRHFKMRSW